MELKIPPLLLTILFLILAWYFASVAPGGTLEFAGQSTVALVLSVGGMICVGLGVRAFRRARTTMNPTKPDQTSTFVVSGIYRISRNPMYLGFLLILVGWVVYLGSVIVLLAVPLAFVLYMNRFQIGPEERALKAIFTETFVAYTRRVRRWL